MARKIIESINRIFESLKLEIKEEDKSRIIDTKKRLIHPPETSLLTSNMKFLSHTKIKEKIVINNKQNVYGLKLDEESYILIPGASELEDGFSPEFTFKVSEKQEAMDGLKLLAMSENLVGLKADTDRSLKLIDGIFGQNKNEANETFYYLDQILNFYSEFEVWKIDSELYDINSKSDLYRLYIIWRISNDKEQSDKHVFALNFSFDVMEQLVKLSKNQNSKYISKVLFRAITSTNWEHCYLELYRCIENLYKVYHIDYLKENLLSDTVKIADSLEKMGLKSREVSDVNKIFEKISINQYLLKDLKESVLGTENQSSAIKISQDALSSLKEAIDKEDSSFGDDLLKRLREELNQEKESSENIMKISREMAEKLYQIRCNIAHLKYKHDHVSFEEDQWQKIVYVILNIIDELYNLYGERLEELS